MYKIEISFYLYYALKEIKNPHMNYHFQYGAAQPQLMPVGVAQPQMPQMLQFGGVAHHQLYRVAYAVPIGPMQPTQQGNTPVNTLRACVLERGKSRRPITTGVHNERPPQVIYVKEGHNQYGPYRETVYG